MTNEQKRQVKDALLRYLNNFETQTQAANSLQGISSSTISQVKNNNWELLSERLWHHIARQVGFYSGEWQPADTGAYLLLRILFSDAQHYAMAYGIAIGSGLGKSFTATHYIRENDNCSYIVCNERFNRKSFLSALLSLDALTPGDTVAEMMDQFTGHISQKEEALLILDDAHKLKDRVLQLVILMANSLMGKVGIVILGSEMLRTRLLDGVRLKKVGYDDIYKSIGRRFITLGTLGPKDVDLVARANGLFDEEAIHQVRENCGNDLHKATLLISQYTEMNIAA